MKQFSQILLGTLLLVSCSRNQELNKADARQLPESLSDSFPATGLTVLPDPLDIKILESSGLDFTSGGLPRKDKETYCANEDSSGFYGRYHLIETLANSDRTRIGHVDIFKSGLMNGWTASDEDQEIWSIQLKSDLISVWDSVSVGLPKHKIIAFAHENNGVCFEKVNNQYSCDFHNFSAVFNIENDTVRQLTVQRNCDH